MSVNKKMTNLADAIRAKSGATGKLSIDRMTTAVNGLFIGVNTSDATARAQYILEGLTAYAKGEKITGTLPRKDYSRITLTPRNLAILDLEPFYSDALGVSVATTVKTVTPERFSQTITDPDEFYHAIIVNGDNNLIPENIVKGKTIFGVEGAADIGGVGGSGGGSADFYKCAEVFGPEKVSGFIVSGAGTAAVNGNYLPTDLKTEEDTPIYKHETAEYYYYEMWGEKGICTSPTQYPSEGLYYNMYGEGWTVRSGGAEPVPTVTAGNITINADVPKTWNGYKAVWSEENGYAFEETVTEGLTYGSALNPTSGGIYDSTARIEVSKLFETVKPITTNDTACLIYIDGTTLANQGLAPNKHDVTFGSGVTAQDGYLNITNDESGQILTTAKMDGYGGNLKAWTWDYFFISDASYLDCSGHSGYGWTIEGGPGVSLYFRGQNSDGKKLGVTFTQNELVGLSLQWDDGVLHVWNKGKYVGTCTPTFPNCDGTSFGIGCIADGDFDRMADKIKLFRFSNKARYTPGVDFELPEGFL